MSTINKKVREISCQTLFKGFLSILEYVFELPENKAHVTRTVITRPSAAAALLINKTGKTVVLIRQFRAPVYHNNGDGYVWEIPAGVIEEGEDPSRTIIRETLEETGFRISNPILISPVYPTVGLMNEIIFIYYDFVEDMDRISPGGGVPGEDEFLEVHNIPFDEAFRMIDSGEITDGKTLISLLWLKNYLNSPGI